MIFLTPKKIWRARARAKSSKKFLKFKNIAKFGCFFENFENLFLMGWRGARNQNCFLCVKNTIEKISINFLLLKRKTTNLKKFTPI